MRVFTPLLFVFLVLGSSSINGDTDPNDASALRVLFQSLNSPGQLTKWTSNGGDPCGENWKGVTYSGENWKGVTSIRQSEPQPRGNNNPSTCNSSGGGKKSGVNGGAISKIVISVLVVGAIIAFFLIKKRSRKSRTDIEKTKNQPFAPLASNLQGVQEMKVVHAPSTTNTKAFEIHTYY